MTARQALERCYWQIQRVVVPGLRDAQYEYKDAVHSYVRNSSRWLDLGCGHHLFGGWMVKEQQEVLRSAGWTIGMDYEIESLRKHKGIADKLVGDVYRLPLKDQSLDLVTANMVMEHFEDPGAALREIRRVLTEKGIVVFHTPNFLNYQFLIASLLPQWLKNKLVRFLEGRHESDVFPTFYRANSMAAITSLAGQAGYTVRELKMVNSSAETIVLGPVVVFELLLIRLLNMDRFQKYRSNIVAALERA
jgi:ubiquinone/menaquinone biosynthesis C-methylase UbiE